MSLDRPVQLRNTEWTMISSARLTMVAATPDKRLITLPLTAAIMPTTTSAMSADETGSSCSVAKPNGALGIDSFFIASGVERMATP